jgi:glycine dehydrogenase subunit 1
MGPEGLRRTAAQSHANTLALLDKLQNLKGVRRIFGGPLFHEVTISLPAPVQEVLDKLKAQRILGGLNLEEYYPELGSAMLICATETKTSGDLANYAEHLGQALDQL